MKKVLFPFAMLSILTRSVAKLIKMKYGFSFHCDKDNMKQVRIAFPKAGGFYLEARKR